jgi:hypothetical protein
VQSELVPTSASSEYSLPLQQPNLSSTSQHRPQTTCASFLINRLLNDREDGNQHPPFSPEFELDHWNDDDDDNEDITDYADLCSKRAMQASDMLWKS